MDFDITLHVESGQFFCKEVKDVLCTCISCIHQSSSDHQGTVGDLEAEHVLMLVQRVS